jgi:hypothetical protein
MEDKEKRKKKRKRKKERRKDGQIYRQIQRRNIEVRSMLSWRINEALQFC